MQHLRQIKVKCLPPTNFKGARVSITDTRHHKQAIIPWNDRLGHLKYQAITYLNNMEINIVGYTDVEGSDFIYFYTDDFATPIK